MISMREIVLISLGDLTVGSFENKLMGSWNLDSSLNSFHKHSLISNVKKVVSFSTKRRICTLFEQVFSQRI